MKRIYYADWPREVGHVSCLFLCVRFKDTPSRLFHIIYRKEVQRRQSEVRVDD